MARTVTDRADALAHLAEVFREHGYDGASISRIGKATGLGKGSLYHFFPGGKGEMMASVLSGIDAWFEEAVFHPLERGGDARAAIEAMVDAVTAYFRSGERVCLVGAVGMGASRDPFAEAIAAYFARWIGALAACLVGAGLPEADARERAEDAVAGIQGAIVLSRALDDRSAFLRVVSAHRARLLAALAEASGP